MALEIPLRLERVHPFCRWAIPFQASIPLPQGAVRDAAELRITAGNAVVSAQFTPLSWWPDKGLAGKSVKWILADFVADSSTLPDGTIRLTTASEGAVDLGAAGGLSVTMDRIRRATVDTGLLSFLVDGADPGLITQVRCRGQSVPWAGLRLTVEDDTGQRFVSGSAGAAVTIEESGPVKAMVRVEGEHRSMAGLRGMRFALRITCYARQSAVWISHALINCEGPRNGENLWVLNRASLEFAGSVPWERVAYGRRELTAGDSVGIGADMEPCIHSGGTSVTVDAVSPLAFDRPSLCAVLSGGRYDLRSLATGVSAQRRGRPPQVGSARPFSAISASRQQMLASSAPSTPGGRTPAGRRRTGLTATVAGAAPLRRTGFPPGLTSLTNAGRDVTGGPADSSDPGQAAT